MKTEELYTFIIILTAIFNLMTVSVYTKYSVYTEMLNKATGPIETIFFSAVIGVCIGTGGSLLLTTFAYQVEAPVIGFMLFILLYGVLAYPVYKLSLIQAQKKCEDKKLKQTTAE